MKNTLLTAFLTISVFNNLQSQVLTLDPSFGQDGIITYQADSMIQVDNSEQIKLTPNGKLLVAGFYDSSIFVDHSTLLRLESDGSLDLSFGNNGFAATPEPIRGNFKGMVIQNEGKIIAGGTRYSNGFMLVRFLDNGTLDTTFGDSGIVVPEIEGFGRCNTVFGHSDGSIYLGGFIITPPVTEDDYDFAVLKFLPTGDLDSTFGSNGIVVTPFGNGEFSPDVVEAIAIQPDNKIVAVGRADGQFAMARYESNGDLDVSFGLNGKVVSIDTSNGNGYCEDVVILNNGKILVGGNSHGNGLKATHLRYLSTGELDLSFGINGFHYVDYGTNQGGGFKFTDLVTLNNGDYLSCGIILGNPSKTAIGKLDANGNIQQSFQNNGFASIENEEAFRGNSSFTVQPNGKILALGKAQVNTASDFRIARYLGDPSLEIKNEENQIFRYYPNPCEDQLTLEIGHQLAIKRITAHNIAGQQFELEFEESNRLTHTIKTSCLSRGLNLLKITLETNQLVTMKILKK